jgi:hypothetical protein
MSQLSRYDQSTRPALSLEALAATAPSIFAESAHPRASATYRFISTREVLEGLMGAQFVPVAARQTRAKGEGASYARHVVRFRFGPTPVPLFDSVAEIVLINSHDGRSAYQLSLGLYRLVCTNGLMIGQGLFDVVHVPHRQNVVIEVVAAALRLTESYGRLSELVHEMAEHRLEERERVDFARRALALRYAGDDNVPIQAEQLLACRRPDDAGADVWRTFNTIQENLMRGGLRGRAASGRTTNTRAIGAIRREVEINRALWSHASALVLH